VSASEETRIQRVMKRSGLSEEEIRKRIANQWTDDQRRPYCDFEIRNESDRLILSEIHNLHKNLLSN